MEQLRYPVGRFDPSAQVADNQRGALIDSIAAAPAHLRDAVAGLTDPQLDTPYRDGGWTVRQVVHHLPDSHLNAYVRMRWALTEDSPAIKTYDERAWAQLPDARSAAVEVSLRLLESLHARWNLLLRSLTPAEYERPLLHPEWGAVDVGWLLRLYEWHGRHHVAQITNLRAREGW